MNERDVIVVTTPDLPRYEIVKVLGTVHGLTVRTRGIGEKFLLKDELRFPIFSGVFKNKQFRNAQAEGWEVFCHGCWDGT